MFNKFSRVVFVLTMGLCFLSGPAHGLMSMEEFLTEAKSGKMTTQTFNDTLNERARAGHPLAVAMISLSTSPAFYEKFPHIQSKQVVRPSPEKAHPVWTMYFEALPPTWLSDSHFWGALLLEKSSSLSAQALKSCQKEGALYYTFLSQKDEPPHPIGLSALQHREDFTPEFRKYIVDLNDPASRKSSLAFQQLLEGEMIRCATEKGLSLLFEALSAYGTVTYEILDRIRNSNGSAKDHPLLKAHGQFLKTFEIYSYFSKNLLLDETSDKVKQQRAHKHLSRLMARHGPEIREPDTLTLLGRLSESLQHYSEALNYFGRAIEAEKSKIPRKKKEKLVTQYYLNLGMLLLCPVPGTVSPAENPRLEEQVLSFTKQHQNLPSMKFLQDQINARNKDIAIQKKALLRLASLRPSQINDKDPFTVHRLEIHKGSGLALKAQGLDANPSEQIHQYQLSMEAYKKALLGFRKTMEASSPSDREALVQELESYEKNHNIFLGCLGHHLCQNLESAFSNDSDNLWLPFPLA